MDTAINTYKTVPNNKDFRPCAPASVVQRVHNKILDTVHHSSDTLILTAESGKGKSTLLRAIAKNIASKTRIIFFNGSDLLPHHPSKHGSFSSKGIHDFKIIKDFIYESAQLEDKLVVIVDAADCLPLNILSDLIGINDQSVTKNSGIHLIMAGLPDFINKLNEIEHAATQNLIHCSMDDLNEEDILIVATKKEYRNKPKGELEFKQDALEALSSYVQGDQQLLDVVLEWCAAIANNENVYVVTNNTAAKAISYAELVAKDKNVALANCYPYPKDLHTYSVSNKLINVPPTNGPDISTPVYEDDHFSSMSHITIELDRVKNRSSNEIPSLKDEVMPTQWVPARKDVSQNKKPFLTLAAMIAVLTIGLVFLIVYRLQPNVLSSDHADQDKLVEQQNSIQDTAPITIVENETETPAATENFDAAEELNLIEEIEVIAIENDETAGAIEEIEELELSETDETGVSIAEYLDQFNTAENLQTTTATSPANTLTASEINTLLQVAAQQFDAKKLTTPAGDNALNTYQSILDKVPNHGAALQGIQNIHDEYVNWANHDAKSNRPRRAKYFYTKAQQIEHLVTNTVVKTKSDTNTDADPLQVDEKSELSDSAANTSRKEERIEPDEQINLDKAESLQEAAIADSSDATSKASEIITLLERAAQQYQVKKLTTPDGDNAFDTYQTILAQDPNHQGALQGIQNIHDKYVVWANYYLQINQIDRAKFFYTKALEVDPEDQVTQQVLRNLTVTKNTSQKDASSTQQLIPQGDSIQAKLFRAEQKLQQININFAVNRHDYRIYQEVVETFQGILKVEPENKTAVTGLAEVKSRIINWADTEVRSSHYNLALFLYEQALSIGPDDTLLAQRIEEIKPLSKSQSSSRLLRRP